MIDHSISDTYDFAALILVFDSNFNGPARMIDVVDQVFDEV